MLLAGTKKAGEKNKAVQACNDYLRMGPGRSLQKLTQVYAEAGPEKPPTRHLSTLKIWSANYDWQTRAELYDAEIERRKNEYVDAIITSGLATVHERVSRLKDLAEALSDEIFDEDGGLKRFNFRQIRELRGALNDLAKETGGRKRGIELSGPAGKPIQTEDVTGDERRARRVAELLRRLKERKAAEYSDTAERSNPTATGDRPTTEHPRS